MCEGEGLVCEGDVMGVKVKVCRMKEKERCVMVRIGWFVKVKGWYEGDWGMCKGEGTVCEGEGMVCEGEGMVCEDEGMVC